MKNHSKLILIFLLAVILLVSCTSIERDFTDGDLLITQTDLPDNWEITEIGYILNNVQQESGVYLQFSKVNESYLVRGSEDIFRYRIPRGAAITYKDFKKTHYVAVAANPYSPVSFSSEVSYFSSRAADQWDFDCNEKEFASKYGDIITNCNFLAQYEEFVITFGVIIYSNRDDVLDILPDIPPVLQAIDRIMIERLELE